MRLTAKELATYEWPRKNDHIVFDEAIAGFGLRKRDGRHTWIFQYAVGGAARITRRIKIGDYPALPPPKARKEAEDLHAKVHLHGDPAIERRKNRSEAGKTFGWLADQYIDFKQRELRPRSLREVRRHLFSYAKPLHGLSLASVDRGAVARLLIVIAKGGPTAANRARATMSAMFAWAMREGLVEANPVVNTNRREEKTRDRVLTDPELAAVWHALQGDDFGIIVRILMLTGQRRSEISGLRWPEVDFDRALISLPGERTKNGRPHDVPMSSTVYALLKARPRRPNRELIFGVRGNDPFSGWAPQKRDLDKHSGVTNWKVHDLRRTVATGMADIGVQPHIVEAVLNHVSGHKGGVAGIYNRAAYTKEKAEALARWDEHVRSLAEKRGR